MTGALSASERELKTKLEGVVCRGIHGTRETLEALGEIGRRELYRDEYGNFADYCRVKWRLSHQWVYQCLGAEKVRENISGASTLAESASRRSLAELKSLGPADQKVAFHLASDMVGGKSPGHKETREAARAVTALRERLEAEGLARLEELDEEQLRREHNESIRRRSEDKKEKDHLAIQDKLRHAAKAMRRLGWNDLALRCTSLAFEAEQRWKGLAKSG